MGAQDGKRGFLKPENRLQWKSASPSASSAPKSKPSLSAAQVSRVPRPKGMPSNAMPLAEYTMDQLKKMAESRGLSVEKLLAQMIQQYLKEE
jgi:predicted DNA-binding ribbon-helix-helix protein